METDHLLAEVLGEELVLLDVGVDPGVGQADPATLRPEVERLVTLGENLGERRLAHPDLAEDHHDDRVEPLLALKQKQVETERLASLEVPAERDPRDVGGAADLERHERGCLVERADVARTDAGCHGYSSLGSRLRIVKDLSMGEWL